MDHKKRENCIKRELVTAAGHMRLNVKAKDMEAVAETSSKVPTQLKNKSDLSILCTNVDGISNKLDDLITVLNAEEPDLVLMCETKLNIEIGLEGWPASYSVIRRDRSHGIGRGGGVCIMIKKGINFQSNGPLNDSDAGSIDHLWCHVLAPNNEQMLLVGVIYRPPATTSGDDDKLRQLMKRADSVSLNIQLLVSGDFNFPNVNWRKNDIMWNDTSSAKFKKVIDDLFLIQNVKDDTRVRINYKPSLLDLLFTRSKLEIRELKYLPGLGKSDHVILLCTLIINTLVTVKAEGVKHNYYKINEELSKEILDSTDWQSMFLNKSMNECYTDFLRVINKVTERCVPLKKQLKLKRKQEWLSDEVRTALNRRDHSWRKYREDRTEENLNKFSRLRNLATRAKRRSKFRYEMKLAYNIKNDKKHFFSYVRGRTNIKSDVDSVRDESGARSISDKQTADILNNAFQSVFVREHSGCIPKSVDESVVYDESDTILKEEIIKAIDRLQENKPAGPDNIPGIMLKRLKNELIIPVMILFNKSYEESCVPDIWKCANIIPIFKKGKTDDPLNYRPVSLTCILCKLFETIIKDRLLANLSERRIMTEAQHGFRRGRSVVTNLLEFYDGVVNALDNKDSVDIIYFDMAKAFDTVKHSILMKKLEDLDINKRTRMWIADYLSNRKQRVIVRGEKSDWLDVYSGVPQGSVIGPVLFLLHINDITVGVKSFISVFADDTKVMSKVNTDEEVSAFNHDLRRLEEWCITNEMKFNTDKCSVMHCGSKNRCVEYKLFGASLRTTVKEKDLGVTVSHDMKFKDMVAIQTKKANRVLGMIKRNFSCINKEMFTILYSTLVRPHLETAIQVWSPSHIGQKNMIEQVQRRATKLVKELKNMKYDQRMEELSLMSTETRRRRGDMILMYKMLNNKLDIVPSSLRLKQDDRTRGHSLQLKKTHSRLDIRKNYFYNRVINEWNGLGQEIVKSPSVESFKRAYDQQLIMRGGCSTKSF